MRALAVAAAVLAGALTASSPARARVTDPTAVSRYDTRFDIGAASPVGMAGGAINVNWQHVVLEGSLGWGLTGAQATIMPKWVARRWSVNTLMLGLGATVSYPTIWSKLGYRWSLWETAEISWQRVAHIDRTFQLGVGLTRGIMYASTCAGPCDPKTVYWPSIRVGWGIRH